MSKADEISVCCKCKSRHEEEYYRYDNNIYCFDCLTEKLEEEKEINIVNTKHYYNNDWGELGTDDEISEVIQNLCDDYEIEVVE